MTAEAGDTSSWTVEASSVSSPGTNSAGDNAQVPEDDLKKHALKSGETKTTTSPAESAHSKQASS
jgi:hypothetical protein